MRPSLKNWRAGWIGRFLGVHSLGILHGNCWCQKRLYEEDGVYDRFSPLIQREACRKRIAIQYDGTNVEEIAKFVKAPAKRVLFSIQEFGEHFGLEGIQFESPTGYISAYVGDWIVRGQKGKFSVLPSI